MSRSNVRGPNSALTEFLRSRGISIPNSRGRAQRNTTSAPADAVAAVSPADTPTTSATAEQEELDAAVAQELAAALEAPTSKLKRKTPGKSKKRKKGEEDEAYDPADEPDYGRSGFTRKERPAAGQIDFCAECNCRFTITVYNKTTDAGILCSACGSVDAVDRPAARVKPKPATRKKRAKAILDGETDRVPKLQDMAIKCIAQHIQDVEALGDIGQVNMDKICQIISKHRSLTDDTVELFLDSSLTQLALYDCAKINPQRLKQVAQMCPHLTELRLHMVGQIEDTVLRFYGTHLTNLKSIALRGCFLLTINAWIEFFETVGPRLEVLEISDSSRFNERCVEALVKNCPNLRKLTLARLTHLGKSSLAHLARLQHLTKLDISSAAGANEETIKDEHIIELLSTAGQTLEVLNLSGVRELTDLTLSDGILAYCTRLTNLLLNELDLLTDEGLSNLFSNWSSNPPLLSLELERCPGAADRALDAIVTHSGMHLRHLNLNSLDHITDEGVLRITQTNALPLCETLDLSWVRAVDDLVLRRLLGNATALKKLWVFGNNRITECETSSRCLIIGRESG